MPGRDVRVLAFHAAYRCRDSGVCCTSNWPIPIEADRLEPARVAIGQHRLRPARTSPEPLFASPPNAPPDSPAVLATCDGACVFHDPAGRCAIHSALGHDALPLACRQFPRVSVVDPRGVSVTLSHYCPTAASLLRDAPQQEGVIVVNTPAFPADGEFVGLDATRVMPPLLHPGVLMDWDSWWEFERLSVEALLETGGQAADGLALVRGAVHGLHHWSPAEGDLRAAVRTAFGNPAVPQTTRADVLIEEALNTVPTGYRERAQAGGTVTTDDRTHRRFLAAHAFANWTIHGPRGLAGWLRSVETAHAFIESGTGVRHADLVLRHLAG